MFVCRLAVTGVSLLAVSGLLCPGKPRVSGISLPFPENQAFIILFKTRGEKQQREIIKNRYLCVKPNQTKMEQKTSVWKGTLNSGLILGLVLVLFSLLLWFFNQALNQKLASISYVFLIAGLYLGIKDFRDKSRGGFLSYGGALGAGVVISIYVAVITAIFTILLYQVIDPGLIEKVKAVAEDRLVNRGMSDEQIEMAMKVSGKFMNPVFMAINALIGSVFIGTIISLFLAIFLKREGETPFTGEAATEETE